jgi:hypothetical protein
MLEITAMMDEDDDVKSVPRVLLWPTLFLCTLSSAVMLPVKCSVVD